MSNRSYPSNFKYEVIKAYQNNGYSLRQLCFKYQISKNTFYKWKEKFEKERLNGLAESKTWKRYSNELKVRAVEAYLSGEYSQEEVIRKYEISSHSVLQRWIKQYNGHRELKDTGRGRTSSMTKGRKTTWEEKIEIAVYCLENGKNYQKAADKYKVSYQQVYHWVKKYEIKGAEALEDTRGRTKSESELSPEEKMKLEMKRMKLENERLRAENAFLKKLEEIERRRK